MNFAPDTVVLFDISHNAPTYITSFSPSREPFDSPMHTVISLFKSVWENVGIFIYICLVPFVVNKKWKKKRINTSLSLSLCGDHLFMAYYLSMSCCKRCETRKRTQKQSILFCFLRHFRNAWCWWWWCGHII